MYSFWDYAISDAEEVTHEELPRYRKSPVHTNINTKWTKVMPNNIFTIQNTKFRPQHNETAKHNEYCHFNIASSIGKNEGCRMQKKRVTGESKGSSLME